MVNDCEVVVPPTVVEKVPVAGEGVAIVFGAVAVTNTWLPPEPEL